MATVPVCPPASVPWATTKSQPPATAAMAWRTLPHIDPTMTAGVVEAVDDVARNPEAGDEQRRAAIDDVTDPGVHLVRKGREQVDTEWLRREGAHGGDLLGQLGRSHRRRPEGADATRLGHGSDEAVVGHPTHPGAHHRMFDVEQLGEPGAHRPDGSQPSA